ncbi:VOC family protein [uncultured Serinicoccus sp.]|uniref:VOC family protein n=1 Tax=uncultured Serinicoccus sp. TaxID=735514 RepID=UPI00261518B0|nr:VOC family protein [uncultured Serinicoccus sp.]
MPALTGLRFVKLPVTDLARSREWWSRVFGWSGQLEFPDSDGVVRGVAGVFRDFERPGLSLRESPEARSVPGLELMLGVADRGAVDEWGRWLDDLQVPHSPVIDATVGWLMVLGDPDGHEIHLYSDERHGIDQTDRAGYGRPAADVS